MFFEFKYQNVIDLCGNFTIFTYTNGRKNSRNIHCDRMEHQFIQNKLLSCIESIGTYFKSIINKATKHFWQKTNIIRI